MFLSPIVQLQILDLRVFLLLSQPRRTFPLERKLCDKTSERERERERERMLLDQCLRFNLYFISDLSEGDGSSLVLLMSLSRWELHFRLPSNRQASHLTEAARVKCNDKHLQHIKLLSVSVIANSHNKYQDLNIILTAPVWLSNSAKDNVVFVKMIRINCYQMNCHMNFRWSHMCRYCDILLNLLLNFSV